MSERQQIPEHHRQKLTALEEVFQKPLENYFPELRQTVAQHLEIWQGFNADESAERAEVEQLIESLIGIADVVSQGLQDLRTKKGRKVPPPSIVRAVWKTDFLKEGERVFGYLMNGGDERKYLLYASFRREPDIYSDLTILFQMLKPGEDTGKKGVEVHCRADEEGGKIKAAAQCVEVYRVFAGHVDIEVDGVKHHIGPGYEHDTVVIPPGSRHRVVNTSGKTSQILIVMGGGSARGFKINKEDGLIEIKEGVRVSPPDIPKEFTEIRCFRKSPYAQNQN